MSDLYEKLLKVQSELKAPKTQFNNFGKYKYRSAEDILEAVKPLLAEYGLVQTITDELVLIGDRYYTKATVTILDAESDNSISVNGFAREPASKKGMDPSQITGASSSYARKYAMNGMYAIDDNKDSDNTNKHGQDKKKQSNSGKYKSKSKSKNKKSKLEEPTQKQVNLALKLLKSHVFPDNEKQNIIDRLDNIESKKKYSEAIDWIKTEITDRKAAEKQEKEEAQND